MDVKSFDLIVLGAGNAGFAAASGAKQAGQSVLIIESRDIGGTCPLRGCVPKKVLVAAAETLDHIASAQSHHIHTGPVTVDWPALIKRKQTFAGGVPAAFEQSLIDRGIEIVRGRATFVDRHTVSVEDQRYRAKKFVITSGSKPRSLPIAGFEHTVTSDDILDMDTAQLAGFYWRWCYRLRIRTCVGTCGCEDNHFGGHATSIAHAGRRRR